MVLNCMTSDKLRDYPKAELALGSTFALIFLIGKLFTICALVSFNTRRSQPFGVTTLSISTTTVLSAGLFIETLYSLWCLSAIFGWKVPLMEKICSCVWQAELGEQQQLLASVAEFPA